MAASCEDPEGDAEFIRYVAVSRAEEARLQRLVHLTARFQCFKILGSLGSDSYPQQSSPSFFQVYQATRCASSFAVTFNLCH